MNVSLLSYLLVVIGALCISLYLIWNGEEEQDTAQKEEKQQNQKKDQQHAA